MKAVLLGSACVLLLLPSAGWGPIRSAPDAAAGLVAAERAFAARAQEAGANTAFTEVFAKNAIWFRPGPVDAHQFITAHPMRATLDLRWVPVYAEVSADGKMGYTTGPATFASRGSAPTGASWYVSVWVREGDGWKLRSDAGVGLPQILPLDSAAATLQTRSLRPLSAAGATLARADSLLLANYPSKFQGMAEPDALVLRSEAMPVRARAATPSMLWSDSVSRMSPEGWAVAGSGDLGFVYGTVDECRRRAARLRADLSSHQDRRVEGRGGPDRLRRRPGP